MSAVAKTSDQAGGVAKHPLRPISYSDPAVSVERRDDGTIYLRPVNTIGDYPTRVTDYLHHWAKETPDRVFMAERGDDDGWREITYAQMLDATRRIASGLLARNLSPERPIVILSGNSVDHALVAFGALYAGIPFAPVSPAYSLVSKDYGKLNYLMKLLTPGLVFVDDGDAFADAIRLNVPADVEVVVSNGALADRGGTTLSELLRTPEAADLDAVNQAIGPDTIAKFLLTSGSTGNPKAVINTQRMMCANQIMLRDTLAFLKDEPPVIIDWLPWNHTFGGNHNIGLTLFNGGSMYLDFSARASRRQPASRRRSETCVRSRRQSISTSPRVMSRCCPICARMRSFVKNSSRACTRCSSPARLFPPMSGTVSTNSPCRPPASACRCSLAWVPPRRRPSSCA